MRAIAGVAILFLGATAGAQAARHGVLNRPTKIMVRRQTITVTQTGPLNLDTAPIQVNGHTLVPLRGVFEAMGARVRWVAAQKRIEIIAQPTSIALEIGNDIARVGQETRTMDVAPRLYHQRAMVPLRFVAETLGAQVAWDPGTRTISINQQVVSAPTVTKPAEGAASPQQQPAGTPPG